MSYIFRPEKEPVHYSFEENRTGTRQRAGRQSGRAQRQKLPCAVCATLVRVGRSMQAHMLTHQKGYRP